MRNRTFGDVFLSQLAQKTRRELLETIERLPRSEERAYYLNLLGEADATVLEEVLEQIEPNVRSETTIEFQDWSDTELEPCGSCAICRGRQIEMN